MKRPCKKTNTIAIKFATWEFPRGIAVSYHSLIYKFYYDET